MAGSGGERNERERERKTDWSRWGRVRAGWKVEEEEEERNETGEELD